MDVRWTCPRHGLTDAASMGDGVFCLADDPARPEGVCGRKCGPPAVITATGKRIEATAAPVRPEKFNTYIPPTEKQMLKPGTKACETCGADLAGKHNRTRFCSAPCHKKAKAQKPGNGPRRHRRPKPPRKTIAPAEPHDARAAAAAGAFTRELPDPEPTTLTFTERCQLPPEKPDQPTLLERIAQLEGTIGDHCGRCDLLGRIERLEKLIGIGA